MLKSSNMLDLPSELELKLYYKGYDHGDLCEYVGNRSIMNMPTPARTIGNPSGVDQPIKITDRYDLDLAIYSIGGIDTLPIYNNQEEYLEYRAAIKDAKRILNT